MPAGLGSEVPATVADPFLTLFIVSMNPKDFGHVAARQSRQDPGHIPHGPQEVGLLFFLDHPDNSQPGISARADRRMAHCSGITQTSLAHRLRRDLVT